MKKTSLKRIVSRLFCGIISKMRVMAKKIIYFGVFALVTLTCFSSLFACKFNNKEYMYFTSLRFFNTNFGVTVFADKAKDGDKLEKLFYGELCDVAEEVENLMSISVADSEISRYNRSAVGEKIQISKITAYVLQTALQIYEDTNGAYNPAVAKLVDLWGFSPRFKDATLQQAPQPYDRQKVDGEFVSLPEEKYVTAFIALTDLSGFEIEQNNDEYFITKTCPSVVVDGVEYTQSLDLGGIAKGYVVDECVRILRERGYEYGYVNLGSSSLSMMNYFDTDVMKDGKWKVSIASPTNRQPIAKFNISDSGISTSGTYENCYFVEDKEYGHIIDPRTGMPTDNGTVSVTAVACNAMLGDALTTALCVMNIEQAIDYIKVSESSLTNAVILVTNGDKFKAYSTYKKSEIECSALIIEVQYILDNVSE